ncbi:MAG: hypothetical protein IPK97_02600 [Ahniella sp.]|nr:hypothetical protein [Ahniella sp.]
MGTTTGTVNFGNTTVGAGTDCVSLQNNSAGARNFGTLTLNGCGGVGFLHAVGGGAVTASGATNITNVTGIGVSIDGNTSTLSFANVLVNKAVTAGNGVVINNSTGPVSMGELLLTIVNGTGLTYNNSTGGLATSATSAISTAAGPGIVSSNASNWNGNFNTVAVTGSPTQGINLNNVSGNILIGSGGGITGTAGPAFVVTGGIGTVSYGGFMSKTTAGKLVSVTGAGGGTLTLSGNLTCNTSCTGLDVATRTSGTYTFSGASNTLSTGTNPGVSLASNAGASIAFTGGNLGITTTSGAGFTATGGATSVTVTGAGNTLTSTTGTALNVVGTTIGAGGLTFQSISANGALNGIVLNNTGALGGLTVTGNGNTTQGGNNSGGTIQNTTGDAIVLTDTRIITLTNIRVTNIGANNGDQAGAIDATNLAGTNLLQASTLTNLGKVGAAGGTNRNGMNVINTNTALTSLTLNNNVFSDSDGTSSFIFTSARGTSPMGVTVTNNLFTDLVALALQINAGDSETGVHTVTSTVTGNTFSNASPTDGQGGLAVVTADDQATVNTTISGNQLFDLIKGIAGGNSEILLTQTTGGALNGTVLNNTIGTAAFGNGDRRGIGIIAEPDLDVNGENGAVDIIHDGNTINRLIDREAIFVDLREDTGNSELIVRNNSMGQLGGFVGQVGGIREALDIQTRGEVTRTFNTHILNNVITGNFSGGSGESREQYRQCHARQPDDALDGHRQHLHEPERRR